MRVVALISWIITALAGATLFSIWLSRGGLRRQGPGASRFPRDQVSVGRRPRSLGPGLQPQRRVGRLLGQ